MKQQALITGAGSGVGRALSSVLADRGINVLGIGRHQDTLIETQSYAPDKIQYITADIAKEKDRIRIANAIIEPLDFLIHNAAIVTPIQRIEDLDLEEWRYTQQVNVEAPIFLTQALLPHFTTKARILNLSSGLAHHPMEALSSYCVSKAALFMFYRCFNQEFKDKGIACASARPGKVDSSMQAALRQGADKGFEALNVFKESKNELNSPQEVALFLANILLDTTSEDFSKEEWSINK